nr:MAG TPA: hypothetical protein [Bacteriophage sp.]
MSFLFCSLSFDLTIQYYIALNMSILYCNKNCKNTKIII